MDIKEYLINCILDDKNMIEELLLIDNKVQYTNLSYEKVLEILKNTYVYDNLDDTLSYIAITDGEVDSVLKVLVSSNNLIKLYVNRSFLGFNKYLVKCVNEYYGNEKIKLDDSTDYQKYVDKSNSIILCGFDTFVEELGKEFKDCELIIL